MTAVLNPTGEYISNDGITVGWGYSEEKCLEAVWDACIESQDLTVKDVVIKHSARFLKIKVVIPSLCPDRELTVGVILKEFTPRGLVPSGFKVYDVKIGGAPCPPVEIRSCFVLPEGNVEAPRSFRVCIVAHRSHF